LTNAHKEGVGIDWEAPHSFAREIIAHVASLGPLEPERTLGVLIAAIALLKATGAELNFILKIAPVMYESVGVGPREEGSDDVTKEQP
jgi:hypothetical protein